MILTPRLTLIPATVAHARAEIEDRAEFARLLGATVPDNWPPELAAGVLPLFFEWLEAAPDRIGWYTWYALIRDSSAGRPVLAAPPPALGAVLPVLGAGGGFLGPPADGEIKIGYSVLPQFQQRGYATEMVGALVRWAFGQPGVLRIVAETEWANPPSMAVLTKLGFVAAGPAAQPGGARFVLLPAAGNA